MLKLAYIALNLFVIFLLIGIGFKAIDKTDKKRKILLVGALVVWQIYMYVLGSSGILMDYSFPPKFALLMIIPIFAFTAVFAYKNKDSEWLLKIPAAWLIYFQSFRVFVEILFVYTVAEGILHTEASIEGYNYDMLLGASAPIIALLVFQKKILSKKALVWWNLLGLTVFASIIFVFMTSLYLPQMYGSDIALLPKAFGQYPYMTVPGFLMPAAVFIHVLSLIQLRKMAKTSITE